MKKANKEKCSPLFLAAFSVITAATLVVIVVCFKDSAKNLAITASLYAVMAAYSLYDILTG